MVKPPPLDIEGHPKREVLLERLDALAARLEDEGLYVDANICVSAYIEICGQEPPKWRQVVERDWPVGETNDPE